MQTLVVLPSYNEKQNIVALIAAIFKTIPSAFVCVVDDSSPDGTAAHIEAALVEHPEWKPQFHLILRNKKDGRGGAVRDGFRWGLDNEKAFEAFVEMDCDFSHEPDVLPKGIELLQRGADMVIGARYPGGTIIGWPLSRKVFSYCANQLARILIDRSVSDYTNGYRFYNRKSVELICKHPQKNKGYIYLSETLAMLLKSGAKIDAFPIIFRNRERGVSNTNLKEIVSALKGVLSVGWDYRKSL